MSVEIEDLARRLVIGRKRDGRSVYDPQAKRELIEACRQPGVSMAKVARACGINANQLSSWVRDHEKAAAAAAARREVVEVPTAFVPMHIEPAAQEQATSTVNVQVRLPNGVVVDLRGCELQQAGSLIEALGRLRCSASTKG